MSVGVGSSIHHYHRHTASIQLRTEGHVGGDSVVQTPSTGLRHILPSTTAVFNYAIASRKLSADEQFSGAQTVVSLLQTTNNSVISHVCYITDNVAYASSNKAKIV